MKVVCVGDCGIDHYLPSNAMLPGGISANFARHAQREFPHEDEIHLLSAIGSDDNASTILSALESTDISCHITSLEGETPVQYIEVQTDGERKFVRYEAGVLQEFILQPSDSTLIADSDLLVAPVYAQITDLFDQLMSIPTSGMVAIDFSDFLQLPDFRLLEDYIANIDVGFFGLSTANEDSIAALQRLADEYNKVFVVTLGAAGSVALRRGAPVRQDAVIVENVVDTTGAGDGFAAGFLSRFAHSESLESSLAYGAKVAAGVVQHFGGIALS